MNIHIDPVEPKSSDFDADAVLADLIAKGPAAFPVSPEGVRVVHISVYCFLSFPVRGFHSMCLRAGADSHAIFFKNSRANYHAPVTQKETDHIKDLVKKIDPQVILVSLLAPYAVVTRELLAELRKITDVPIVIGGKYATIEPERALEFCDYACQGEGELPLLHILDRLARGKSDFTGIKGLWHKGETGEVVDAGQNVLIGDLDLLTDPAVGEPNMYFIEGSSLRDKDPELNNDIISVMAGRGCVYQCTYCVNALLIPMNRKNGKLLRLRSPERVIAEVKALMEKQPYASHVLFHDEVLGMYNEWVEAFTTLYKKEIGLPFEIELIPKLIKKENVELLADAGMTEMGFGIQSGSQEVRNKVLRRPGSNQEVLDKAQLLRDHGVNGRYDIILDNPFETEESLEEGLGLLMSLPHPIRIFPFKMQYFRKYPFSEAALEAKLITEAEVTDEAVAQSTMYNWTYIPKVFDGSRINLLQSAIYLYSSRMHTETKNKIAAYVLRSRNPLGAFLVNLLAWIFYQYGHRQNPLFVWARRLYIGIGMILRGDFGRLTANAQTVLRRILKPAYR